MKLFRKRTSRTLALLAAGHPGAGDLGSSAGAAGRSRVLRVSPEEVDHIRISTHRLWTSHAITVTEPEDIQFVIDTINSFSYAGNDLKCILRGELFMSGTLLYELSFSLRNGDAFTLCLAFQQQHRSVRYGTVLLDP